MEGEKDTMKVFLDCFPCFLRQALVAARKATDDVHVQREALNRVARMMPELPMDATPVAIGREVYRVVSEVTGCKDVFCGAKREYNDRALELLPALRKRVENSADSLLTSLRIAAAGNVIDFGASSSFDLERSIEESLSDGISLVDYPALSDGLERTREILYIGDNAGEIVFDRLVVEELNRLGKRTTFVVRGGPIINDVTLEDAEYVGMDRVAEILPSGSDEPGTTLSLCSAEFVERFSSSKLIIAKGQGNYEGLSDEPAPLFFLLKVKCAVVARALDAQVGEIALRAQDI